MSQAQYKIYRNETFNLAKTLILKLDEVSLAINNDLIATNRPLFDENMRGQFPHAPIEAFYKYYLNLSGQYHLTDTATLLEETGRPYMQITLIGNNGTYDVDFTRELLVRDPAVANEYSFGSYYYNDLVERYPNFEPLILGILYPVKLELAVSAYNGEILSCGGFVKDYLPDTTDTGYVETTKVTANGVIELQEINFISELQRWIDKYIFRWTNIEYAITDDLYVAASLSVMYMQIPAVMMNIRLQNCHTPYAHSFHIRQYLESHGRLGHVIPHLPIEVSLWLYRNMSYYETNLGKEYTMMDVVDNVFTPAAIPLAGYATTHNVGLMPTNILPTPALSKEILNFDSIAVGKNEKSIAAVLTEGMKTARDNERDYREAYLRINDKIRYTGDDTLSTKVLESKMLSLPGKYPFTLTSVLLNLWLYSSEESDQVNKGINGAIFVTNPLTGRRMSMTLINAYKVALYCFNKGVTGGEYLNPPPPEALHARSIPRDFNYTPTPHHKLKPSASKLWGITHKCTPEEVAAVYSQLEWKRHFISAEDLNKTGTGIFLEMVRQFNVYTKAENLYARAELELCMNRHYWSKIPCKITLPMDYPVWLESIGVTLDGLSGENLIDLGLELVGASTGLDLTLSKRRADAQRAAIDVLKHFTSYTVQILDSVSFDTGLPADTKVLRIGNINSTLKQSSLGKCLLTMDASLGSRMRFSRIYEEFGEGTAFISGSRQQFSASTEGHTVKMSTSRLTFKANILIVTPMIIGASIDIPEYYSNEVPPPPVTEAQGLTYYKSDKYPNPTDD